MVELLNALKALERLSVSWKIRRVTKTAPYDTVECVALVQTSEGVVRGLVEVRRGQTYGQTKAEVACYLDGKLDDKGGFKHLKHPKHKTVKVYEYENLVHMKFSEGFLSIGRGYSAASPVPAEHQYLADFAERLAAGTERQNQEAETQKAAEECARKSANEVRARRALFR